MAAEQPLDMVGHGNKRLFGMVGHGWGWSGVVAPSDEGQPQQNDYRFILSGTDSIEDKVCVAKE